MVAEHQALLTAIAQFERLYSYRLEVLFVGFYGSGARMPAKYKDPEYRQRSDELLAYSRAHEARITKFNLDSAAASLWTWSPAAMFAASERDCHGKFSSLDGMHLGTSGAMPILLNLIVGWIEKLTDIKATSLRSIP